MEFEAFFNSDFFSDIESTGFDVSLSDLGDFDLIPVLETDSDITLMSLETEDECNISSNDKNYTVENDDGSLEVHIDPENPPKRPRRKRKFPRPTKETDAAHMVEWDILFIEAGRQGKQRALLKELNKHGLVPPRRITYVCTDSDILNTFTKWRANQYHLDTWYYHQDRIDVARLFING